MQSQTKFSFTRKLTESAVMLALTVVLSFFKLVDLPYGGSITLFSMLPVILIAYRHGLTWGLMTGFANGVLQLLMGLKSLSYATSAGAAVAIILLDYLLAFTVTGFGGVFRKRCQKQTTALVAGTVLACVLRYLFHVISGCTVWAGLSIPDSQALLYSLAYNATYMLPELLITVVGAAFLSNAVGFDGDHLTRLQTEKQDKSALVWRIIGAAGAAAAAIADVVLIGSKLQNAESGDFDITGIANVNFLAVGIITVCGIVLFVVCRLIAKNKKA